MVSCVESRVAEMAPEVRAAAEAAGAAAAAEVGAEVAELLAADIDAQRENPLAVLRRAVRYPTEVLLAARAAPPNRDDFAIDRFPDDVFDLTPASFADIPPRPASPGRHLGGGQGVPASPSARLIWGQHSSEPDRANLAYWPCQQVE